jgi:hypothetical protein
VVLSALDRRVLPEAVIAFVRESQRLAPSRLGGEAALSAAFLSHRLSRDVDLICDTLDSVRTLVRAFPAIERSSGASIRVVRDAGSFVRAVAQAADATFEVDVILEGSGRIDPHDAILEGIVLEPLADLRAAKLTCIPSRSEPRDLVDVLFLERAGYPPERDLENALRKDVGMDPGVLGWLLGQFPVRFLPTMLQPVSEEELRSFRDELRERFRRLAVPTDDGSAPEPRS